jgi:RNA polymerase sigma-70 factor (ECF subfamily)
MGKFRRRPERTLAGAGPEEPADPELLRRMRQGDESALEALYRRYGGLVYTLALRIVGDPELAREVLQDTFLRAWDGREMYDSARRRVPWWLMGIARNRAIDLLRSRSHQARLREQERLTPGMREPAPADTTDELGLRGAVTNALQSLSTVQRRAIELAYYGGLTQVEIARELSVPVGVGCACHDWRGNDHDETPAFNGSPASRRCSGSRGRRRPGGGPEHLARPESVANLHELSQLLIPGANSGA